MTIVDSQFASDAAQSAILLTFAGIPHVVTDFTIKNEFYLHSSAIVSFNSTTPLNFFIKQTTLLPTFSDLQQVFVYCENVTFRGLEKITISEDHIYLLQNYAYYIIEEQENIRLLTVVFFQPENCLSPRLVELRR